MARIFGSAGKGKGSLPPGRDAEGVPVQLQIKYCSPDGDAVRRTLLFRLRVSGNGLFLAISAPSVPLRGSFFQKGQRTGHHINPDKIKKILTRNRIHIVKIIKAGKDQPSFFYFRI